MQISRFLAFLLVITAVTCWNYNNPYLFEVKNSQIQEWIDQPIDHFNYNSDLTFGQRYYVLNDYFQRNGPAYLYICGEAECKGISNTSWTAEIARQTGGIIFALEHRYYGKSLPFGDQSLDTDKLQFLNSEQALSDLAYFIQYIRKAYRFGVTE